MAERLLTPQWISVTNDEGWVEALLSWWSAAHPKRNDIGLETGFQTRRPDIHETLVLNAQGKLTSKLSGQLFAQFDASPRSIITAPTPLQRYENHEILQMRYTDLNRQVDNPCGFYFQVMCEYLPVERNNVSKMRLNLFNRHVQVPQAQDLHIKFTIMEGLSRFELSYNDHVLCQAVIETKGPRESRYDSSRIVTNAEEFKRRAHVTRLQDNVPVRFTWTPFPYELDAALITARLVSLSSLAVSEILTHAFPDGSPFVTELQENGQKRLAVFWRSATVQVFNNKVDCSQGLTCQSWIDRVGSSSFVIRTDFSTPNNNNAGEIFAALRFTLVQLDIPTKRTAPLSFTSEWANQRYQYGAQSPAREDSFLTPPKNATWSSPPYDYKFDLRQYDTDLNGHCNSAVYLVLIEDAKHAAVQAGYLPAYQVAEDSVEKAAIDYVGELHFDPAIAGKSVIRVMYQIMQGNKLVMRYEFYANEADTVLRNAITVENTITVGNKL